MVSFLSDKLIVSLLINKIPTFCGTCSFITMLTKTRHLPPSGAILIRSPLSRTIFLRSLLILSSHLGLNVPSCLSPSGLTAKILRAFFFSPHTCHVPCLSSLLIRHDTVCWEGSLSWSKVNLVQVFLPCIFKIPFSIILPPIDQTNDIVEILYKIQNPSICSSSPAAWNCPFLRIRHSRHLSIPCGSPRQLPTPCVAVNPLDCKS